MRGILKQVLFSTKFRHSSKKRPLSSSSTMEGGRSTAISSNTTIPVTEREGFLSLLPSLVAGITQDPTTTDLHPHLSSHMKKAINYNIAGGKMNRGISVPISYSLLCPSSSETRLRQAAILGWTVEFMQAFFLVVDDIMDGSETRRGKPCWFRREDIGLAAFNDGIILESCVYSILRQHFRKDPCYLALLEDLLHTTKFTTYGQALDLSTASDYTKVQSRPGSLDAFTMSRYSCIVKYKTSYYSFVLPVHLAMRLAGLQDDQLYSIAADILFDIGHYFQVCDDYLDCYGDPLVTGKVGTDIQDGKCSWLMATALDRCSSEQRQLLERHYGSSEPNEVSEVRAVYRDLKLKEVFKQYEEEFYSIASQKINKVEQLPKEMFTLFLERIYQRKS